MADREENTQSAATASASTPASPYDNILRAFEAMDISMMKAHRKGDDASRKDAEETAKVLLGYTELPLVIRARACMILGCSDEPGFLEHAKEGVRIAEIGNSSYETEYPRGQQLLKHCKQVLTEAQEAFDAAKQERAGRGDGDDDDNHEGEEEEMSTAGDGRTVMKYEDGKLVWFDEGFFKETTAVDHAAMEIDQQALPEGEMSELPSSSIIPTSDVPQTSDSAVHPDSDDLMSDDVPDSDDTTMVIR